MYRITRRPEIRIDYLNQEFAKTSALLYDTDAHLYARDASYIGKKEEERPEGLLVPRRGAG